MLNKLKRKIVYINVFFVGIVLVFAFAFICFNSYNSTKNELLLSLQMEAENDFFDQGSVLGNLPNLIGGKDNGDDRAKFSVSYVRILIGRNHMIISVNENNASIDNDLLNKSINIILNSDKKSDVINSLGIAYSKHQYIDGSMSVIIADNAIIDDNLRKNVITSVFLYIFAMSLVILISIKLSKIAVKPVDEAWQQQKQFISDASHELKTPLTVILANNNILSNNKHDTIENQQRWINSTQDEAEYMKGLIDRMLTLARTDEERFVPEISNFDLSELVFGCALYFESSAYEKDMTINCNAENIVNVTSDKQMVAKIINILIENAIKYGYSSSEITVSVTNFGSPEISISNYGESIPESDIKHLFDRFYRADKTRGKTGYGLGLSIAQSTAKALNLNLFAECKNNIITFHLKF